MSFPMCQVVMEEKTIGGVVVLHGNKAHELKQIEDVIGGITLF